MKRLAAIMMVMALSGCSASSALTGLIGSKPEVTAQAGAENIKQTVGVTAKQDTSSKQETSFEKSNVGKVDTSNKKKVSASSIQAETITAERIEIRNTDSGLDWKVSALFFAVISIVLFLIGYKSKKGA
ncbi:putative spanin [Escherichia phage vB_EcoS_PHB17]|uniref:Putative spanin n=1 Tax=Escherichia phage vB_EcoS_PHB17 TaxID=2591407 RepID=A0A514DKT0_9CAUD|nr:Rz-like spanin [Escherichia phage vB_EcoS_PHB17]QDH94274.1 putative spanin [Escherichia phage vB_EcoS_PHB17]